MHDYDYTHPLMMSFEELSLADHAADTFAELGYEPYNYGDGRLHIHVHREDLTSALEIMQHYGGRIRQEEPVEEGYTAITIPAHIVNEDWADGDAAGRSSHARNEMNEDETIDAYAPYDHFDAT